MPGRASRNSGLRFQSGCGGTCPGAGAYTEKLLQLHAVDVARAVREDALHVDADDGLRSVEACEQIALEVHGRRAVHPDAPGSAKSMKSMPTFDAAAMLPRLRNMPFPS